MTSRFEQRLRAAALPSFVHRYLSGPVSPDMMPPESISAYQMEALREVLARAYQGSPFYQRKLTAAGLQPEEVKGLDDLGRVPFTTKDELRQDPWILLACDKKDISLIHVSTGTTGGEEIYTLHTWREFYLNHFINYPRLVPVQRDDLCFVALPYEMSSAGLAFHTKFMVGYQAAVMPVGKGGAYATPEKTVKLMGDLRPTIVATSPSYAITLAEAAAEKSFDLTSLNLKKIWIGGEGCSAAFRRRVETLWGTTANFSYGSMECGGIGQECDAHNGYHLAQGHFLVEIVDPATGTVLAPGETGEVVVTSLLRFDTPLIRYRTQDLGYLEPQPCSCGITLQRLFLRGRMVDQVVLRGKAFSPFYLEEHLMRLPQVGNWYQFVIQPGDNEQLTVRAEPAADVEPTPELAAELAGRLQAAVGVPCRLEFVARLPRLLTKAVRVVRE